MLDYHGFNLWAEGYDADVGLSDVNNTYPFAGHKEILNLIYNEVMAKSPCDVLDIGIGTGTLSAKLFAAGNRITGVDFSQKMLEIAAERMPGARLFEQDITRSLPKELAGEKFDFIISTYALHHLDDGEKLLFISDLGKMLAPGGAIIIGDVAFETVDTHDKCMDEAGNSWDDDEIYFVVEEIEPFLSEEFNMEYKQISHCGGVLKLLVK